MSDSINSSALVVMSWKWIIPHIIVFNDEFPVSYPFIENSFQSEAILGRMTDRAMEPAKLWIILLLLCG